MGAPIVRQVILDEHEQFAKDVWAPDDCEPDVQRIRKNARSGPTTDVSTDGALPSFRDSALAQVWSESASGACRGTEDVQWSFA